MIIGVGRRHQLQRSECWEVPPFGEEAGVTRWLPMSDHGTGESSTVPEVLLSHPGLGGRHARSSLRLLAALAAGLALAVFGMAQGTGSPHQADLHVLVLDESSTSTVRCPSCHTYIQQYAGAIARDANKQVWVEHLSWRPSEGPPAETRSEPASSRSGLRLRQALGSADLIVLSVGNRHSMITIQEDSCELGAGPSSLCTTSVSEFGEQLRALLTAVDAIRGRSSRIVVVAAPDPHNLMAVPAAQAACQATRAVGGICVDAMQLVAEGALSPTDWHGPDGKLAMGQVGHDAVAHALRRWPDR